MHRFTWAPGPLPSPSSPLGENKGPVILITRHTEDWAQMWGRLRSAQNPLLLPHKFIRVHSFDVGGERYTSRDWQSIGLWSLAVIIQVFWKVIGWNHYSPHLDLISCKSVQGNHVPTALETWPAFISVCINLPIRKGHTQTLMLSVHEWTQPWKIH